MEPERRWQKNGRRWRARWRGAKIEASDGDGGARGREAVAFRQDHRPMEGEADDVDDSETGASTRRQQAARRSRGKEAEPKVARAKQSKQATAQSEAAWQSPKQSTAAQQSPKQRWRSRRWCGAALARTPRRSDQGDSRRQRQSKEEPRWQSRTEKEKGDAERRRRSKPTGGDFRVCWRRGLAA